MLIMHIGHISRTQSFQQNRHILFHALVALKLLVSLISRLVACSARIVVDRQTDRHTDQLHCKNRVVIFNPYRVASVAILASEKAQLSAVQ